MLVNPPIVEAPQASEFLEENFELKMTDQDALFELNWNLIFILPEAAEWQWVSEEME